MAVYLVCAAEIMGEPGPVKIGYANDSVILKRLSAVQTGNHRRLRLIQVLDAGRKVERTLHERFAALRLRGDWFDHDTAMEADLGFPVYAPSLGWLRPWPSPLTGRWGAEGKEANRLLWANPEYRAQREAGWQRKRLDRERESANRVARALRIGAAPP